MRIKFLVLATVLVWLTACGGGGGDSGGGSTVTSVVVSGVASFERVPFSSTLGSGLDYNNIQTLPIRGADVQVLSSSNSVLASTTTSASGGYTVTVPANTSVRIRIIARTVNSSGATWDFEVRDNTSSNALYVLDGSLTSSGTSNSTRNLTAASGWTGASYGAARTAAPFAILDSIYTALQAVVAVDADVVMDDADIFWSINNSTASGTISLGEIGGSFYSNDEIYLVGRANSDTDEYDQHVVIHEWAHYLEDNLSRSDSIGGTHTVTERLDFRVALSEGLANAYSGIATGDPVYRDSFGAFQGSDFQINVETNATTNVGWFNEGSVQTIIYDMFDSVSDANDGVSLGFSTIYNALTSAAYRLQSTVTSIFSLVSQIKADASVGAGIDAAIDTLVVSQSVTAVADFLGTGETNNGGDANNLPVYKTITDNGVSVQVCSTDDEGRFNKLGNRQFLSLSVVSAGAHTVTATRVSGLASSDPDIRVYLNGTLQASGVTFTNNTESVATSFNVDDYVIEVYHFGNLSTTSTTAGDVCFNVTVS